MGTSVPLAGAPDLGQHEDRGQGPSSFGVVGFDPELARALHEQLENSRAATSCPTVILCIELLGTTMHCQIGATNEDCEAIAGSKAGFQHLVVADLEQDPRVASSWRGRGFGASLSTPVIVQQRQIGDLHVFDVRPREFDDAQCDALTDIALMIGKRIERFTGPERAERRESLMCRAVSPAFAELRNALVPLSLGTADLRMVCTDLAPIIDKISDSKGADDVAACVAFEDLVALAEEITRAAARVQEIAMVVEGLWGEGGRSLVLSEILRTAAGLALHSTRLVGGVSMPTANPVHSIIGRRSIAVAGLSLLLSRAAESNANGVCEVSPLVVELVEAKTYFEIQVEGANLNEHEREKIYAEVGALLLGDNDLTTSLHGKRLCYRFTRAS